MPRHYSLRGRAGADAVVSANRVEPVPSDARGRRRDRVERPHVRALPQHRKFGERDSNAPGALRFAGGSSSVDPTVVTSYEQLLFPHNEQTLNMGVLQDVLVSEPGP